MNCNFAQGECKAFYELEGTTLDYSSKGALFKIETEATAPTIQSHDYIFFGRLDVELLPSPGQGIVTSVVLQSDDLDEVDWEWVGSDTNQVQSNYFSKGDVTTYDRGAYHPVEGAIGTVHKYSIEWTAEKVDWIVDGNVVRTLTYADTKAKFPQTPMRVRLGTWVAGKKDGAEGTVEWAGGLTDFKQAPFNAYYKSVTVVDYAGGSKPAAGGIKEYVYGDNSGDYTSIKVVKGDGSTDNKEKEDKDEDKTTSKPPKPTNLIEPDHSVHSDEEKTTKKHSSVSTIKPAESVTKTPEEKSKSTVTPSSTKSTATPSGNDDSEEKSSSGSGSKETGGPETTKDSAAGSVNVAIGTLAFAGVVAIAQLL